ncbi:hypothetical protein PHJA_001801500 [Phtheirospermum japonicum]|uniref:Uncharacterized protein n=1 Tax=Phtheirospermum japonicum TaxID=374723 RepID=A0A830CJX7_9LAMI|nr:hypothetical protein PHJA_001801500 [Phtheirospermum japonicum]
MSSISINGGDSIQLVKVVEYLETSMSKDLLSKFPDNSAFDFDYAQSSIWSPLLPRPPPNSAAAAGLDLSRRLSYGETNEMGFLGNTKKMAARIKRKFTDTVFENISRCGKMKRRKRKSFGLSPAGSGRRLSSSSSTPKAWAKVMKAAVKQFKKRKNKNKNKDQNVHYLSNYLTS